ncbi:ABC transporter permease [Lederbergia wuyishanensis]|uniref:Aldouronate transport system permease protein n=1 Tax=Lederbergia wuyishanensis TaxID=1347903 RepID=A0ABU0D7K8_9BACI|nr:ABC transporter permease subunit [Lederbergia wuyishanensis]MCJ8009021.1 ABC transporter permease subunit [Lederbergia wuyishanensis]MDQ0344353.1 putative aldouronate transport system permease protein [Lederbergia wuyishanensis]
MEVQEQTAIQKSKPIAVKKQTLSKKMKKIWKNYDLYLLLLPTLLYFLIFHYLPMYGVQIAFKNFNPVLGINGSPWIGFSQFERFFNSYQFWTVLKNTIGLALLELATFPIPIVMALLLNQLTSRKYKRIVQTVTYAPHFISVVVLVGMLYLFLSPRTGIVNQFLVLIGMEPIFFFGIPEWFKPLFITSGVWQNLGWGMIIYLAALSGISPELHEAAIMDGASKIRRIWHIDIPGIMPTVIIMLILGIGNLLNVGFEKVYLMQNSLNVSSSEIIQTHVYKTGLLGAQYSYAAAVGLFNSIINFILLVFINQTAKKAGQASLW